MVDFEYPVNCPLLEKDISADTCFDIHGVVEGISPKNEAPEEIFKKSDYTEKCNACRFHRYD